MCFIHDSPDLIFYFRFALRTQPLNPTPAIKSLDHNSSAFPADHITAALQALTLADKHDTQQTEVCVKDCGKKEGGGGRGGCQKGLEFVVFF